MSKYQEKMNNLHYYIVKDQYKLPTQEDIKQSEKQLGFELPSNYKDFLSFYGLSAFEEYVCFQFQECYPKDDKGLFNVFFGIYSDDSYDLIDNYYNYQGRMSSNLLPIASDPGGNIICMSINTDDKGNIYFWDHEDEIVVEKGAKIDDSNLYLIANSFEEFINSLEIDNL